MRPDDLEVVWPLHRSHYLSPALTDEDFVMHSDPVSAEDTLPPSPDAMTPGRELAVRALLAGADCLQQRVSNLLGVSRRTIGRLADADCRSALRDSQALEGARACPEETASRGSSAEEREAPLAWLQQAAQNEQQVAGSKRYAVGHLGPEPGHRPRPNGAHGTGNALRQPRLVIPAPAAPADKPLALNRATHARAFP